MNLRIRDWDKHFENAASRKLKRLDWVAVPIKTDGEGYTALVDHPDAAAHLGAWYAIVEVAAKQTPRGTLPRGIPQNIGGICQSLSRMSRLPPAVFHDVLPRLVEIGWIEEVLSDHDVSRNSGESADVVAESADVVAKDGATGNYRELQGKGITHTQPAACAPVAVMPPPKPAAPRAADLNGITGNRFEEFWRLYPLRDDRDSACRMYISVVTADQENALFACLVRYLASDQVNRGVVMQSWKWLEQQHRNQWQGQWPARAAPAQKLSVADQARIEHQQRMERARV